MGDGTVSLAIETSSRRCAIALGRGETLLASTVLTRHRRHNVALMPGIARLCEAHAVEPDELGEVYVSVGPGSFTGLRVAAATVKMLALVHTVKVAAVPTLDVLAQNVPDGFDHALVCLNQKRETVWGGLYTRYGDRMVPVGEAGVATMGELLGAAERPIAVVGESLPDGDWLAEGVLVLASEFAAPRAEVVWRLGRAAGVRGEYVEAGSLEPLYAREPEAVTLWNARRGGGG